MNLTIIMIMMMGRGSRRRRRRPSSSSGSNCCCYIGSRSSNSGVFSYLALPKVSPQPSVSAN